MLLISSNFGNFFLNFLFLLWLWNIFNQPIFRILNFASAIEIYNDDKILHFKSGETLSRTCWSFDESTWILPDNDVSLLTFTYWCDFAVFFAFQNLTGIFCLFMSFLNALKIFSNIAKKTNKVLGQMAD